MAFIQNLGYKIYMMTTTVRLPITAIAFDLGNVLVKVDHGRFCRGLGTLTQKSPEEVFQAVFATDLEPGFDTGRITPEEFYRRITTKFQVSLPYPRFCTLWNEIFAPMNTIEEILIHLQPRYPLFLLSNTNTLHFQYIQKMFPNILQYFHAFILSFLVGSRKTEPGIFQALIREVGHAPEHILFVDDKLPFVEAARGHGLVAWHFTTPGDFQEQLSREGLW